MVTVWLGPATYDPRMKTEKGNLMTVHDVRFPKPADEGVPGPGTYTVCTAAFGYSCWSKYIAVLSDEATSRFRY